MMTRPSLLVSRKAGYPDWSASHARYPKQFIYRYPMLFGSILIHAIDYACVEYPQRLKDILQDLERPIDRMASQLSNLQANLESKRSQGLNWLGLKLEQANERRQLLQWMSTVPYLTHHKTMINDCLPTSGEWLFRKPEFLEWESSSVSSVLWLHGIRKHAPLQDSVT